MSWEKWKARILQHYDLLAYLFFGGLTTVVNYLVYIPCFNWWGLSATVSNVIAWLVAVSFAFVTNKPFVFQSHDWSLSVCAPEFLKFISGRLLSGFLEIAFIKVTVDHLGWNAALWKLIVSVIIVVLNYIFSKLFAFRAKKD